MHEFWWVGAIDHVCVYSLLRGCRCRQVDVDYGSSSSSGPPSYRLFCAFRSGMPAASWDASTGFIQAPSGAILLMYQPSTGAGTLYNTAGEPARRWNDNDDKASAPPVIEQQLDPHLGMRYTPASRQLELFVACEGVLSRLRCGPNLPPSSCCWDPDMDEDAPGFSKQLCGSGGGRGAGGASMLRASSLRNRGGSSVAPPAEGSLAGEGGRRGEGG